MMRDLITINDFSILIQYDLWQPEQCMLMAAVVRLMISL